MKLWVVISTVLSSVVLAQTAAAAKCSDYRSCSQAVRAWCAGWHPRADGDKDGIPCENVCRSVPQVRRERARIGHCRYVSNSYFISVKSGFGVAKCVDYNSCAEAVKSWCAGQHPGADRDGDGIPCENVCKSLKQVGRERQKINCTYK